jgi:hypothetical protein
LLVESLPEADEPAAVREEPLLAPQSLPVPEAAPDERAPAEAPRSSQELGEIPLNLATTAQIFREIRARENTEFVLIVRLLGDSMEPQDIQVEVSNTISLASCYGLCSIARKYFRDRLEQQEGLSD